MNTKKPPLNRRDMLKLSAAALGGAVLACGKGQQLIQNSTTTIRPPTPTSPSDLAADTILRNGNILTIDSANTVAEAVAVKDSLIQAVGTVADLDVLVGEATQVIELGGKTITPGLIDAHNHFQVVGLMNSYYIPFLPPDVLTVADLQDALAEAIGQVAEGDWVKGYFLFVQDIDFPTRHILDPVSPNNPVFILQQGGHYGSANSLALEIAGITADTPDPIGGVIGRDPDGEPNGVFYNHRAMDLVRMHMPLYTQDDVKANIQSSQTLFSTMGVTSFQDNNVRGTRTVDTYMDAGRQNEMYMRGAVYYTLEWPGDIDRALNEVERYQDDFMRLAGFKFLLDGQMTMAYCYEPHNGDRWDMPTWDPDVFKDAVRKLHDTGLQICVHCVGDATTDLALDAFEEAMDANPRTDPRHRLEHAIITRPESTQRIKDLGVVVSTQPQFIRLGGDLYADLIGEERARRVMVTREWLDAGIPVALGSDAPSTPWHSPLATLIGAVTRATFSGAVHEPDQALTPYEALRAHTLTAAYAAHEEEIKGSIEAGKLADLIVWSVDPIQSTAKELWNSTIDLTMIDGKIVHQI
ncbi:MAG: amidohydrolase [Chloroflexota bacterium]|nr:amidohydrolase [Chloroflexota bacterium]